MVPIAATVPGPDTLDAVRSLTDHPAFSLANPNKVYALIRSFGAANRLGK